MRSVFIGLTAWAACAGLILGFVVAGGTNGATLALVAARAGGVTGSTTTPTASSVSGVTPVVNWDPFNPTFPTHTGDVPTVYPGQETSFGAHWDYVQDGWLPEDYPTDIYVVPVAKVKDPSTCGSVTPRFEIGTDPQFPDPNLPLTLKSEGNLSIGFYWPAGATKKAAGGSLYYAICLHQRLPRGDAPSPDLLSGTLADVGTNRVFEVVSDAKPSAWLSTTHTRAGSTVTVYGRNWRYYHTYTDVPGTAVTLTFKYLGGACMPGTCGADYPVSIGVNGSFARHVVIPAAWVPGQYLVEVSDAYFGGTGVANGASPSRKPLMVHIAAPRHRAAVAAQPLTAQLTARSNAVAAPEGDTFAARAAIGASTRAYTQRALKTGTKKRRPTKKPKSPVPALRLKEFRLPNGSVTSLVKGPDGNLWFTDGNYIGRMTPAGKITEFEAPATPAPYTDQFDPSGLIVGPDGNLWYTNTNGNKIGRVTPQGHFAEFALPSVPPSQTGWGSPANLIAGPDGDLWFTEDGGYVGRITPRGQISEIPLPNRGNASVLLAGKDGMVYFAGVPSFGRIDPATLAITTFQTRGGTPVTATAPYTTLLINGPDGAVWFGEGNGTIGRVTASGQVSEYVPPNTSSGVTGMAFAADGSLWFSRDGHGVATGPIPPLIGRLTPQRQFQLFTLSGRYDVPEPPVRDAHGGIWFPLEYGGSIAHVTAQKTVAQLPWSSKQTQGPANGMVVGPGGKLWYMANQLFIGEILNS